MKPLSVLLVKIPVAMISSDAAMGHQSNQTSLDTLAKDYPGYYLKQPFFQANL